jgi:hypothetical protein
LHAPELVAWLQEHAPEQIVEDRLRKICEMVKTMESCGGTDKGSVGRAAAVAAAH